MHLEKFVCEGCLSTFVYMEETLRVEYTVYSIYQQMDDVRGGRVSTVPWGGEGGGGISWGRDGIHY